MKQIKNEQIKASEIALTGLQGENLGVMPTAEALAMARKLKVDVVCDSLMQSPPPCRLVGAAAAKEELQQARKQERKQGKTAKIKELRLTPQIEEHDYETKRQQAERILRAGDAVLLNVKLQNAKEGAVAKKLLEELAKELREFGKPTTGIQVSGKQAAVQLNPQ